MHRPFCASFVSFLRNGHTRVDANSALGMHALSIFFFQGFFFFFLSECMVTTASVHYLQSPGTRFAAEAFDNAFQHERIHRPLQRPAATERGPRQGCQKGTWRLTYRYGWEWSAESVASYAKMCEGWRMSLDRVRYHVVAWHWHLVEITRAVRFEFYCSDAESSGGCCSRAGSKTDVGLMTTDASLRVGLCSPFKTVFTHSFISQPAVTLQ